MSLALRVLLAPPALQVRVLKVCLGPKDLLGHKELLDDPLLENLVPQVDLGNPVLMEPLVRKETLEPLASRDPEGPLDPLETLDPLVSLLLANLDLLDFLGQWDLVESLV